MKLLKQCQYTVCVRLEQRLYTVPGIGAQSIQQGIIRPHFDSHRNATNMAIVLIIE